MRDITLRGRRSEVRGRRSEVRLVRHIQFTNWSNYGLVEELAELVELVVRVEQEWREGGGPLVIHCAGGLGRTGTFTTILSLYSILRFSEVDNVNNQVIIPIYLWEVRLTD